MSTEPIIEDERGDLPSASRMERVVSCPGSVDAERGMPELEAEEATQEGTDIHEAMETGDATGLDEDGQAIAVRLERMEANTFLKWADACGVLDSPERLPEVRMWIRDRVTQQPIASAKLDTHYVGGDCGLALDFKSGYKRATPSEKNWQLLTQAICMWHEYPHLRLIWIGIAGSRFASYLDISVYTVEELRKAETVLMGALWHSKQPNAPRSAGSWCHYCKARANCRKAAAYFSVGLVNQTVERPTPLQLMERIHALSPEQLKQVWQYSPTAKKVLAAIQARLEQLPTETLESIGLKLKDGKTRRTVSDVDAAHQALFVAGLPMDTAFALIKKSLSVSDAQEALAKQFKLSKSDSKTLLEQTLGGLLIVNKNKPELVEIT